MNRLAKPVRSTMFASLLALAAGPALCQSSPPLPVKIFVLAGQSNMVGHGEMNPGTSVNTLTYLANPANDPAGTYQFLKNGANWKVWDDVWIRFGGRTGSLTAGYGSATTTVGPELGFGHVASSQYENKVLLIKCAWGGKSLGNDFLPPSAESYPPPQIDGDKGYYYQQILSAVATVTGNIGAYVPGYAGEGFEIAGFGWHQGWNDRVTDPSFSVNYQRNMAHFIRDMRSADKGLDVPGLPFVIVTTAMDGGGPFAYSTVEKGQLAMVNPYLTNPNPPDLYTDFVGNVAVVDARQTYNGLQFWHPVQESPADQGFHWNRNAKTYVNIGLAMGDAMAGLTPGRCPSRLRAARRTDSGIDLGWQNGLETPTSVRITRNGVEIASAAPVVPTTFSDPDALPGIHHYELSFTMPGAHCDPLTIRFDGSISQMVSFRSPSGVGLTWKNAMKYDGIQLRRNGVLIEANLPGDSTSYTDISAPSSGAITYTLNPTTGTSTPATSLINLNGLPSGNALIYEPFDYQIGALNTKSGNSELGLGGTWNANSTTFVRAGTLTFGNLPVGGGKISDLEAGVNRFGGNRAILVDSLAGEGMLDDGAVLWFSMIVGLDVTGNPTNTRLAVALANSKLSGANNNYSIDNEGTQKGSGIGIVLTRINNTNGSVAAAHFRDGTFDTFPSGSALGTSTGRVYAAGTHGLIVGKITWAADPTQPDNIQIFQPGVNLVLPATPISVLNAVLPQREFDTLTFARGDRPVLDEIRFGRSYDSVIGKSSFADWIAGKSGVGSQTGFNDDPDGDGVANALENYFGTEPGIPSAGLHAMERVGATFKLTHPLNASPADDLTARYKWSTDLVHFHEDGASADGTLVSFNRGTPSGGMVEVTASISGDVPEKIFVVIEAVNQP
jgi:hypothetical protein